MKTCNRRTTMGAALVGAVLGMLLVQPGVVMAQDGAWVRVAQLGKSAAVPRVVMVTNTATTVVFSNVVSRSDGRVLYRRMQNMGTSPVFFSLGTNAVTTNQFHGVLAGGTAFNNGTGGVVEWVQWPGQVNCLSHTGTNNVATIEILQ